MFMIHSIEIVLSKTFEMSLLPTFPYLHSIGIVLLKTFEMCLSELWSSTMQNHFYVDVVVTNRPALHWSEDTCNGIDNIDGKTGRNIQTNIHPLKFKIKTNQVDVCKKKEKKNSEKCQNP